MLPRNFHGMLCPRLQIDIAQHSVQLGLCGIRQRWTKLWHDKCKRRKLLENGQGNLENNTALFGVGYNMGLQSLLRSFPNELETKGFAPWSPPGVPSVWITHIDPKDPQGQMKTASWFMAAKPTVRCDGVAGLMDSARFTHFSYLNTLYTLHFKTSILLNILRRLKKVPDFSSG